MAQTSRLRDFSLFSEIAGNPKHMELVAQCLTPRAFRAGEYIFQEAELGDELYLLVDGAVRVLKTTQSHEDYTLVDLMGSANAFFGEFGLLDDDRRSASILVLEDCLTYVMNRAGFLELGKQHPEVALPITQVISQIIAERLRSVNNDVTLLFDALLSEVKANQP